MEDLVTSMTRDNPAERPLIEQVLQEFFRIQSSLSKSILRSKLRSRLAGTRDMMTHVQWAEGKGE
jgi:hypothetical protein